MKTVVVKDIVKVYENDYKVLDHVSYEFEKGKFHAIMGRSGVGKTTLLNNVKK